MFDSALRQPRLFCPCGRRKSRSFQVGGQDMAWTKITIVRVSTNRMCSRSLTCCWESRMKQHEAAEPFLIEETSLLEFLQHQVKQIYLEYEGNHQPQRLDLVCAVLLQPCTLQHGHGGKMSVDKSAPDGFVPKSGNTMEYPNLWPWHQGNDGFLNQRILGYTGYTVFGSSWAKTRAARLKSTEPRSMEHSSIEKSSMTRPFSIAMLDYQEAPSFWCLLWRKLFLRAWNRELWVCFFFPMRIDWICHMP